MLPIPDDRRILTILAALSLSLWAAPTAAGAAVAADASAATSAVRSEEDPDGSERGRTPTTPAVAHDAVFEEDDRSGTNLPADGPDDRYGPFPVPDRTLRILPLVPGDLIRSERIRIAASHASAPRTGPPFLR